MLLAALIVFYVVGGTAIAAILLATLIGCVNVLQEWADEQRDVLEEWLDERRTDVQRWFEQRDRRRDSLPTDADDDVRDDALSR